jgi:hypothetical protein
VVVVTVVVAVTAAVEEAVAVEEDLVVTEEDLVVVAVAVEEPVVDEVAKADAGAMAQQTAPRTPNSMQAQKLTAGLVVLMSPKSMIVIPVATSPSPSQSPMPELHS